MNDSALVGFKANGYVVLRNFIPDNLLRSFSMEAALVLHEYLDKSGFQLNGPDGLFHSDAVRALEATHHNNVAAVYDTLFMTPSFNRIAFCPQIESIIHYLTETASPLYGFANRCRIDQPKEKGRTYSWHQQVFYSIPESSFVQLWAPLI